MLRVKVEILHISKTRDTQQKEKHRQRAWKRKGFREREENKRETEWEHERAGKLVCIKIP